MKCLRHSDSIVSTQALHSCLKRVTHRLRTKHAQYLELDIRFSFLMRQFVFCSVSGQYGTFGFCRQNVTLNASLKESVVIGTGFSLNEVWWAKIPRSGINTGRTFVQLRPFDTDSSKMKSPALEQGTGCELRVIPHNGTSTNMYWWHIERRLNIHVDSVASTKCVRLKPKNESCRQRYYWEYACYSVIRSSSKKHFQRTHNTLNFFGGSSAVAWICCSNTAAAAANDAGPVSVRMSKLLFASSTIHDWNTNTRTDWHP